MKTQTDGKSNNDVTTLNDVVDAAESFEKLMQALKRCEEQLIAAGLIEAKRS